MLKKCYKYLSKGAGVVGAEVVGLDVSNLLVMIYLFEYTLNSYLCHKTWPNVDLSPNIIQWWQSDFSRKYRKHWSTNQQQDPGIKACFIYSHIHISYVAYAFNKELLFQLVWVENVSRETQVGCCPEPKKELFYEYGADRGIASMGFNFTFAMFLGNIVYNHGHFLITVIGFFFSCISRFVWKFISTKYGEYRKWNLFNIVWFYCNGYDITCFVALHQVLRMNLKNVFLVPLRIPLITVH